MVLLDGVEDVIDDPVHDATSRGEEFGEDGDFTFGAGDDRDDVHRFVTVDSIRSLLEVVQDSRDASVPSLDIGITVMDDLPQPISTNLVNRIMLEELIPSPDQRPCPAIREQLPLEHIRRNNSNRRTPG